jgi:phosphate:Na+ symporter
MTLQQSIGIILGADIGTTITAQIIAFKVTKYALVLVAVGFGMQFTLKREKHRQYGAMLMGLGLIFFGMELMSGTMKPLRTYQPFIDLMQGMANPLLGILIGTLFTALVESSSATMGIIIVLATQGFITLEAGIALAFGANIGTCITAMLAAIGKPTEAVQAAVAHVIFKVVGVVLWFGFIAQLASIVRTISPSAPELEGTARLAAEVPRQIANAHTLFNVANAFLFIWFTKPFAEFMQRIIPAQPETEPEVIKAKYLDNLLLDTPELALERVRRELGLLSVYTLRMVENTLPAVFHGDEEELDTLAKMDDNVDTLYESIVIYLGQLSQATLLESQSEQLSNYMAVANYIENIGDI